MTMRYGAGTLTVENGSPFPIVATLKDEKTDAFIQAKVINTDTQALVGVYSVPHFQEGTYIKSDIIASVDGKYIIKYKVFKDSSFQILDKRYELKSDKIRVESIVATLTDTIDLDDGRIS